MNNELKELVELMELLCEVIDPDGAVPAGQLIH